MKLLLGTLVLLTTCLGDLYADTICHWNFNSPVPDANSSTGTNAPAIGTGSATLIGGATASFVSGGAPDPVVTDDSVWSTSSYPWNMRSNRTAGVRFTASTIGYENIEISWAQQNSGKASRYMRLQYTLDGTSFADLALITVLKESTYTNFSFDLSGISGATNNPLFGFQLVAEFESTAIGGLPGYIATDNTDYDSSGTIKFDMVTISGRTIGDYNTPPYVFGQIPDQVLAATGVSPALPFLVLDAEEPASNLVATASSSNPAVLPAENIVLGGTKATRNAIVHAAGVAGSSVVGIKVFDSGGKSNQMSFNVTVLPANSTPIVSGLSRVATLIGTSTGPVPFVVYDGETPASALQINASAADPLLVPVGGIVLSGSDSNRALTITPAIGKAGVTPITVTASDGENVGSAVFPFMVLPSADLVLYEPFDYPTGPATTNSGFLWTHRSGTVYGDCVATNSMLRLTEQSVEDISAQLIGAPYEPGTGAVIYVSFKLRSSSLPDIVPAAFAHFVTGNTLVGKISIGRTNAVEGTYRVFAGNGPNEIPVGFPMSMNSNVVYLIVVKYDVDAARTTLWVNPANESSPSVTAMDECTPGRISTFNFRQHDGIGPELFIDDLKVGLSFAAVTGTAAPAPLLRYSAEPGKIQLSWDDPAHKLQSAGAISGPFTNVDGSASPYEAFTSEPGAFFRLKAD